MKLSLVAVGKLKTLYWLSAQEDYLARIRRYAPLSLLEIKDRLGRESSEKSAVDEEGKEILQSTEEARAVVALTPAGKLLDSKAWAGTLERLLETYSRVAFVVGGPAGLSEAVLEKSALRLSLSPMTFPHEMARVIFLEQLYRAFTLLKGEKYHK